MRPQTAKRLLDARNASREILDFTSGKIVDDMWNDRSLQLSLHKLLEIVGEALNQAGKFDSIADAKPPRASPICAGLSICGIRSPMAMTPSTTPLSGR